MAPVVPNPERIRDFADAQAFSDWLAAHHDSAEEVWVKLHKKASGLGGIAYAEAVEVGLCWGWIDGIKKAFDEKSSLQRFSPRRAKSLWSQVNRERVERLIATGRMTPHGLAHVEAAKADGRWAAAYAPASEMAVPDDLLAALEAEPAALEMFGRLNSTNRYAVLFRIHNLRTPAGRARKIAEFTAMLAEGRTIYPNGRGKENKAP